MLAIDILLDVSFSIYFFIRLLTVTPFLPDPSTYPPLPFLRLYLLAFVPLLPILVSPSFLDILRVVSYTFAVLVAVRFTIEASVHSTSDVSMRDYPRLLLSRFDVLSYFVLFCIRVSPPLAKLLYILLANAAICTTFFDIYTRTRLHCPAPSPRDFLAHAFLSTQQPEDHAVVPPGPRDSSLLSLILFGWVTPTVATGRRRALETDDIPSLSHHFSTSSVDDFFKHFWQRELQRPPPQQPSVTRAIFLAFWRKFTPIILLGLIVHPMAYATPFLLRLIIIHLQHRENGFETPWRGFSLACALLVTSTGQSILLHQFLDRLSWFENIMRSAIVSRIYEKITRLSPQSHQQFTSGRIQNLMANDVQEISLLPLDTGFLVTFANQVFLSLVLLVNFVGWVPSLAGIILMTACVPLQAFLVRTIQKFREQASSFTDERVKFVSEIIRGIKLVKLYAWELPFVKKVSEARDKELHLVRKMAIVGAWNTILVTSFPVLLTSSVFVTFGIMGKKLDAAAVFPVLASLNIIRGSVAFLPTVLLGLAHTAASLQRLKDFLCAEELKSLDDGNHAVDQSLMETGGIDLAAAKASFTWEPEGSSATPIIRSISFDIPEGSLVAVVGPTGSGKSTLLQALLGEVPIVSGKVGIRSSRSVAFCNQIPFMKNATVRDNILFGKPFDEQHYRTTIRHCSLGPDLELLPGQDQTEIGSRGVNLSGGQRARLALARAAYSRSDIVLLDDPLSAVDAHVGRSIFRDCIVSQLRGTTRLLTTNQIHFAASRDVDLVIVVNNGEIIEIGNRASLLSSSTSEFAKLLKATGEYHEENAPHTEVEHISNVTSTSSNDFRSRSHRKQDRNTATSTQKSEREETDVLLNDVTKQNYGSAKSWKLTHREGKEEGRVRLKHYATYISALGPLRWALPFLLFSLGIQVAVLGANIWLSKWTEDSNPDHTLYNLLVFVALNGLALLATGGAAFSIMLGSLGASRKFHERLLVSVLGAPSSFFQSTPDGRIINRFHSDMDSIDSVLARSVIGFTRITLGILFAIGLLVWTLPALILLVVPILVICLYIQDYYRRASVDIRRLHGLCRSPLYSHIGETLEGIVTIRAYRAIPREKHHNGVLADTLNKVNYAKWYANRWLGVRLDMLSVALVFVTVTLAVFTSTGRMSASLTGLILSYITQIITGLTWVVRTFTDVESDLSSVERISEYSQRPFPQESANGITGLMQGLEKRTDSLAIKTPTGQISDIMAMAELSRHRAPVGQWPTRGKIEFDRVFMRYRKDLEPALRNLSFSVQPGEHIGIVGRTGAGKTSTIQCLFRLYDLEKGKILIDGIDISTLCLSQLRSSLGIIPQEPVCFSGTIRSNLDMIGDHSDIQVQEALNACGLQATSDRKVSLDDEVSENGSNLSVGQRQLLCLGRALLKNSQVVVLDEATSSVTNETDEAIQKTLEERMHHCTIFTVAHRLHTVMKCDKIIVMDKGRVAEIGRPDELLKKESRLRSLVDETGSATAAKLVEMASQPRNGKIKRRFKESVTLP